MKSLHELLHESRSRVAHNVMPSRCQETKDQVARTKTDVAPGDPCIYGDPCMSPHASRSHVPLRLPSTGKPNQEPTVLTCDLCSLGIPTVRVHEMPGCAISATSLVSVWYGQKKPITDTASEKWHESRRRRREPARARGYYIYARAPVPLIVRYAARRAHLPRSGAVRGAGPRRL